MTTRGISRREFLGVGASAAAGGAALAGAELATFLPTEAQAVTLFNSYHRVKLPVSPEAVPVAGV